MLVPYTLQKKYHYWVDIIIWGGKIKVLRVFFDDGIWNVITCPVFTLGQQYSYISYEIIPNERILEFGVCIQPYWVLLYYAGILNDIKIIVFQLGTETW